MQSFYRIGRRALALLALSTLCSAQTFLPISLALLVNAAATGTQQTWTGGQGVLTCTATSWGGATATLQYVGPNGSTLVSAGVNTTFTANGNGLFYLQRGALLQMTITGGPPTGVYCTAYVIPIKGN